MREVYCQIKPRPLEGDYLIRFVILGITRETTLTDIKLRWGRLEPAIERAFRVAKADPWVSMELPEDPIGIGFQFELLARIFDDPDIDLFRVLMPQIRGIIEAAVEDRDRAAAGAPTIWTPS